MGRLAAHRPLLAVLACALLLRAALTPLYAYLPHGFTDEGFWKFWMQHIHDDGVLNIFRTTETDYVGYHWVLWLLSLVYDVIGGPYGNNSSPSLHILVKWPSIVFDMALIVVVWAATRTLLRREGLAPARADWYALVASVVVALHPAVVYDSAVWAQTDSAVAAAMLASVVLAARGRPGWAGAVWALGFMVKPHPIVVAPVVAALVLRRDGLAGALRSAGAAVVVALLVLTPWLVHGEAGRIAHVYRAVATADYGRLSSAAWNLWWPLDVARQPLPEDAPLGALPWLTYRTIGTLLSGAAALPAIALVWRAPRLREALIAASYLVLAFYMLPISTHERYMFPLLALLLPVALRERRWRTLYCALSVTFTLNLLVSAPPVEAFRGRWVESPLSVAVACVNIALFFAGTALLLDELRTTRRRPLAGGPRQPPAAERQRADASALTSSP